MTGEGKPYGVDINTGGIADSFANFVWEPAVVKVSTSLRSPYVCRLRSFFFVVIVFFGLQINAINAATEAACLILSVDETIKNPKVQLNLHCLRIKTEHIFCISLCVCLFRCCSLPLVSI